MKYFFNSRKQFVFGYLIFFAVFSVVSFGYIQQKNVRDINQFHTHAKIISNDLWAMSQSGVKSYLQLAVQANHYKHLAVTLEGKEPFFQVNAPLLSGLDSLLHSLHLLPFKKLSTKIEYQGHLIGFLQGEQCERVIYPLLNIFIFLLLLMLVVLFVLNLYSNRRLLEQQVLERTRKYRESERRFHDLVNLLPEIVCETDAQGDLTYANKIAFKQFAISDSAIPGVSFFNYIVPDQRERAIKNFAAVVRGREQKLEEFTARSGDGTTFPVLIRSAPIYAGIDVSGIRSVIIDITERCSLEKQLRRAQKMEVIGLMAGGVAHDLNNILSGVINYPELILMQFPDDRELRGYAKAIKDSGLRAAEVVNDLLTVSRGVVADKIAASPNGMIMEYLESPEFLKLKSLSPGISWTTELDPAVANIVCSPLHVKKCIMNLFTNAAEAIPGSGRVIVSTEIRRVDEPGEQSECIKKGAYVVVTINDTGPGIAPRDLDHIFEPFYTKKVMGKSGTGLGLTVVWNTMQDHDGEIRVNSDEKGTTFSLYFPATGQEIERIPLKTDMNTIMGKGDTILVIDDDPLQQIIALQLLTTLNYKVTAVSSGEEAIDYLRTRFVHLLLLDMLMPPGINGLQTYKQVLAIHPKQKAVIASGFSESKDVKEALELGAAGFIKKPYTMEQLGRMVYTALQ
jgi:PAS domain S-box-containing protein